jgi:hypothetical protein
MLILTTDAELYNNGLRCGSLTRRLVLGRNGLQHGLLTLIPTPGSQLSEANVVLTELCRLAALLYGDVVLFPLPWATGVKRRLSTEMREVWHSSACSEDELISRSTTAHVTLLV